MRSGARSAAALGLPAGRIAVISPHLDDAALSLGTVIAAASRQGRIVNVVTVLAGDPGSRLPAGGWDRRGGFVTEGDAATGRREEDLRACKLLGAEPVWLPFPDSQYQRPLAEADVVQAVHEVVRGADAVLLPGHPLTNRDHAWVTGVLTASRLPVAKVGFYVEQPYTGWLESGSAGLPDGPQVLERFSVAWSRAETTLVERWRKVRAIRSYRSQLAMLGFSQRGQARLVRLLSSAHSGSREAVGWIVHDVDGAGERDPWSGATDAMAPPPSKA